MINVIKLIKIIIDVIKIIGIKNNIRIRYYILPVQFIYLRIYEIPILIYGCYDF